MGIIQVENDLETSKNSCIIKLSFALVIKHYYVIAYRFLGQSYIIRTTSARDQGTSRIFQGENRYECSINQLLIVFFIKVCLLTWLCKRMRICKEFTPRFFPGTLFRSFLKCLRQDGKGSFIFGKIKIITILIISCIWPLESKYLCTVSETHTLFFDVFMYPFGFYLTASILLSVLKVLLLTTNSLYAFWFTWQIHVCHVKLAYTLYNLL